MSELLSCCTDSIDHAKRSDPDSDLVTCECGIFLVRIKSDDSPYASWYKCETFLDAVSLVEAQRRAA
jgi:hypothetical protein